MSKPRWRQVKRYSGDAAAGADLAAIDDYARGQEWPSMRMESPAGAALALPAERAGAKGGGANQWLLVVDGGTTEADIAALRDAVQDLLPADQRVGFVGRAGGSAATAPGDSGIGIEIQRLPAYAPKMGKGVSAGKAPEGGLSGRESWFRGRTGRKPK